MKRISFNVFFAFILLLQSCIKENLSDCNSELLLRFRYTLNDQHANLFGANIHRVAVYIFDSNNKYVAQFSEQGGQLTNDYVMRIPLAEGRYNIVVYGGDFTTYQVGELNYQTNTLDQTLREGVTDIADLRTELKYTAGAENYLYPLQTPDDLYASFASNAIAAPGNDQITDVELILITKKVKVKITGTDAFQTPLDVYITAQNGRYRFDSSIDTNQSVFKYMPINTFTQPNYLEANLKTMRLMLGQSPMLVIKNSTTQEVLYDKNMIAQILLTPQYVAQEDFDREDEFVFEISVVNHVIVSVSINGWIINSVNPDV